MARWGASSAMIILMMLPIISADSPPIAKLDLRNFDEQVRQDQHVWLVQFLSSKCGTCQKFRPAWERLAALMPQLRVGEVDIEEVQGMALADEIGVLEDGIPNIRLYLLEPSSEQAWDADAVDEHAVRLMVGEPPPISELQQKIVRFLSQSSWDKEGKVLRSSKLTAEFLQRAGQIYMPGSALGSNSAIEAEALKLAAEIQDKPIQEQAVMVVGAAHSVATKVASDALESASTAIESAVKGKEVGTLPQLSKWDKDSPSGTIDGALSMSLWFLVVSCLAFCLKICQAKVFPKRHLKV